MTLQTPTSFTTPEVVARWQKVLDAPNAPKLKTRLRRDTVAQLLENQSKFLKMERRLISEAQPTSVSGNVAKWDPVLISMVRRIMPQLIANDIMGVQPMSMPTGLVFAKRARYQSKTGPEAFISEPNTAFTGAAPTAPGDASLLDPFAANYDFGHGMSTAVGEGDVTAEMTFTIEKTSVEAVTRNLKSTYSIELAQDLQAVHGMDADAELTADMQEELTQEMNRQAIRTVYKVAKLGAEHTGTPGVFNAAASGDGDGRWLVERFKTLMMQIELEANKIFFDTRRGKGNKLIVSANVASAMAMAGILDYAGALAEERGDLTVDPVSSTYAGKLNGMYDVYVDPFIDNVDFVTIGFKGASPFDAGLFTCPYTPFMRVVATDPQSGQPIIFFKTRYGMVANPFVVNDAGQPDGQAMTARKNPYYRIFKVTNLVA